MTISPDDALELIDMLDAAAKRYPIKALAGEVDKGESTLRNELTCQPGYKLGIVTSLRIMDKTRDLAPMDWIEERFDRVAVPIRGDAPASDGGLVNYVGKIAAETGDVLEALGQALLDHRITRAERAKLRKETYEAMRALATLWMHVKE